MATSGAGGRLVSQPVINRAGLEEVELDTPVTAEALRELKCGQVVYLNGLVYTGREALYAEFLDKRAGQFSMDELPFAQATNVNFHCSPAASVNDDGSYSVGAVTATASFRFSKWMPRWMDAAGTRLVIGKGGMSGEDYRREFAPRGAAYLTTVGYGTGALLGAGIKSVRDVYFLEEFGIAQAAWLFEVERFGPFIVDGDVNGNSLFEQQNALSAERIKAAYEGLGPPALRRYGETDDRAEEVI